MDKTAIWLGVAFIAGTLFNAMLNAAGVDIYKGIRAKAKRDDVEILPSKRPNTLTIPIGYQGNIPHRMAMDIYFNLLNHSISSINMETVSVEFDDTDLPMTILPLRFDDTGLQDIDGGKTSTLKAGFKVDITVMQASLQDNFNAFIQFLEAIPADLSMKITVAYLNKGKHHEVTTLLPTRVRQTIADNWLTFLNGQPFGNAELLPFLEGIKAKLNTML